MKFEVHITTKNRKTDLKYTLDSLTELLLNPAVTIVIFDDGSIDGTSALVQESYPKIKLYRNEQSRGYLYCRNVMLNTSKADFVISLDDDASFLSAAPLEEIASFFSNHPDAAVLAFRIYWSPEIPNYFLTDDAPCKVRGFVGCGHAWRMSAWKSIESYPEWFQFYGEETYAALLLYRANWFVYYTPSILVHHRVDMKQRRTAADFNFRYRRSLRADWYLYFLFYPAGALIRFFGYSLLMQFRKLTSNPKMLLPLVQAMFDVIRNSFHLFKNRKALSKHNFVTYQQLVETPVYWKSDK